MPCVKLLGQRLVARGFDRQVAELQVRVAVLNGYTALGMPLTEAVGQVCPGNGAVRLSLDLCNKGLSRLQIVAYGSVRNSRGSSLHGPRSADDAAYGDHFRWIVFDRRQSALAGFQMRT